MTVPSVNAVNTANTDAPAPAPGVPRTPPVARTRLARVGQDFGYLLAGLPIGIAAFVVAVVGFCLGLGLFVVWLGLPVLVGTLAAARGFARLERGRVQSVTGAAALPPHHYPAPSGRGLSRLLRALLDPQSWRDLLHMVLAFPLRVASFAISVPWVIGGLGGVLYVLWEWALPRTPQDPDNYTLIELITGNDTRLADILFTTACGAVLLGSAPFVLRGLTAMQTGLAKALLTSENAALRARAEQLADRRRAAAAAEAQTLRRVERDIHDGPQQRLVRLNIDLETAARRLDDDPEAARPLVTEALTQSREALAELRAVSRGIAPPILADRGLGPALAAAAARCPVEVSLDVALAGGQRLAEVVENTAYFVVTEALTNVAKHSAARHCTVQVVVEGAQVHVRVVDDGRGGAHPGKGHGLAGLADRLAALGGRLALDSPPGGPTRL
ncbi:MAG TPA: sensor domain-containing protein, partial [Pseudonocardiaceae bacterium]|nr:sensor domain-containing protein [Pseudonocardiaceae bacterium]